MRSPSVEVLAGALAPSGRRDRRRHDVLEAEPGAGAAVVAGGPAAVLDGHPGQRVLPVAPEEVAVQPGRDVVPRQRPRRSSRSAVADLLEAEPLGRQGLLPQRRGRSARTTPGRCRRPARPARSPRPSGGRPGWPALRPPTPPGRASGWSGPGAVGPRSAAAPPCARARPPCPGRTTGTACGPWARTPPPRPPR